MFITPKIVFEKTDEDAVLPYRNSISDPGYIFNAVTTKILPAKDYIEMDTGLSICDIVKGVWMMILPIDSNNGIEVKNGIINNTFRGNLKINLYNNAENDYLISMGDPFAQIVFFPLLTVEPEIKQIDESL